MNPVTIDLAPSGKLRLNFGHEVDIPATEAGLNYIVSVLQARHVGLARIAEPGAPTQAQVDEFFRHKHEQEKRDLGFEIPELEELGL